MAPQTRPNIFYIDVFSDKSVAFIPANLSPFGEIHRFELKIGHPRESWRSDEFLFFWGGGEGGHLARCR